MRHDVVVYGATGFTGKLVAEYLAKHSGGLDWAIAGRSREKLEAVRRDLGLDVPMILADAADPASLHAMARAARVVCTTVGPYAKYGAELVAACVAEGSHYCDLTGEPHFMHAMITKHHAQAQAQRVKIVHACGFDSIPSDLGTLLLEERAIEAYGRPLTDVRLYVRRLRGGASGGTIASAYGTAEAIRDPAVRRVVANPYSLLPEGAPKGPRVNDTPGLGRDRREGVWIAPFVMGSVNAKVVRRSNALLGMRYGADLRYDEVSAFKRMMPAAGMTVGLFAGLAAVGIGPIRRRVLPRFLPNPGEGPDEATRKAGRFTVELVGRGERDGAPVEVRVTVEGDQDPGYGATSGMLGESAMCLAQDTLPERFGVLTAASAMGVALVERLPRAGVTFAVTG